MGVGLPSRTTSAGPSSYHLTAEVEGGPQLIDVETQGIFLEYEVRVVFIGR
jgi:hypothetical protein